MITQTIDLDLTRDDHESDRAAMRELLACEPGTRVDLHVGDRRTVTGDIHWIRQHVSTLHLNVRGRTGAVNAWLDALHERGHWECM